jgi:hypothetical protein
MMFTDRLLPSDDDATIEDEIAEVDERYKDVVKLLHQKPDDCVFLVMTPNGLSFFYNFDDRDRIASIYGMFALAAHSIAEEMHGSDAADAMLGRVLAECVGGEG